jgi:hypothetical protein
MKKLISIKNVFIGMLGLGALSAQSQMQGGGQVMLTPGFSNQGAMVMPTALPGTPSMVAPNSVGELLVRSK